jgi:hypothetical protein
MWVAPAEVEQAGPVDVLEDRSAFAHATTITARRSLL